MKQMVVRMTVRSYEDVKKFVYEHHTGAVYNSRSGKFT